MGWPTLIANSIEAGPNNSVNLRLKPPLGYYDSFLIELNMRAPSGALIQFEVQNFSVSNSSEVLVTFENVQPGQVYELWSQVSRLNRLTSRMNLSEALVLLKPLNVNKLIVYTAGNRTIDLVWQEPVNGNYDEYLVSVQESNGLTHFANYTQLTQVRVPELDTNKTYLITVVTCVKLRNRCDTISSQHWLV